MAKKIDKVRENRVRRAVARRGMVLLKRAAGSGALDYPTYLMFDELKSTTARIFRDIGDVERAVGI